jgi:hypothetical protein
VRRPAPTTCPVCQHALRVARLECDSCHTAIEGDFDGGKLGHLSREQLAFVEVFVECRGKIKDVEQRLGLSYPTVVSRLEQVVGAMGEGRDKREETSRGRRLDELLEALSRGEISAADVAEQMKSAKRKGSK